MDIKGGWIPFHLDRSRKLGIYFYSLKLYCVLNIVTNLLRRQVQYPTYFQEGKGEHAWKEMELGRDRWKEGWKNRRTALLFIRTPVFTVS